MHAMGREKERKGALVLTYVTQCQAARRSAGWGPQQTQGNGST